MNFICSSPSSPLDNGLALARSLSFCLLIFRMYPKIIMYAGILGATTETSVSK